jgi:UDP-glucose 4-epimerase
MEGHIMSVRETVLLVGASGRVGQMIADLWAQRLEPAMHVIVQGRQTGDPTDMVHLNWDPMAGPNALWDWTQQYGGIKTMIVLAGVTPGGSNDVSLNTTIAQACLNAAAYAQISRVLIASSSAVYGVGDGLPFSEDAPCSPVNDYGHAKLEMERACDEWRSNELEVCCLRIGNVAGADALLLNIARSEPDAAVTIDIFEDGHGPRRSYIGPESLARVLERLALYPETLPACLNIATPQAVSMDALADALGHPWTERKGADERLQNILLDCRQICALHSFAPSEKMPDDMITQWKNTLPK